MRALKINRTVASFFICFLVFMMAEDSYGAAIKQKLEDAIKSAGPQEEIPIIIKFSDKAELRKFRTEKDKKTRTTKMIAELKARAELSQASVKKLLESKGRRARSLWVTNGLATSATKDMVRDLALRPEVESIQLDYTLEAPVASSGTAVPEWNIDFIKAPELWARGFTGSGMVVASMDTGVDANHPDLGAGWLAGPAGWFDPNAEHATPYDASGHGTMVVGLMVGGSASGTAVGVAPDAKWKAVKIFNDSGVAYISNIHAGFQWMLDPDDDGYADPNELPDVINNSWGLGNVAGCDNEFFYDIEALKTAGASVVFAAGNYGPLASSDISPANYRDSFPVGAIDELSQLADFSSRGPSACYGDFFPEVSAPGVNVKTTDLTYAGVFPNSYSFVSGTSFSAAHLSGTIALLSQAFMGLEKKDIEFAIRHSSRDLGAFGPDNASGSGALNALDAYNFLLNLASADIDGDTFTYFNDCNDEDRSVNPGKVEIKHDGIDQDCNGYDLTIDVIKAAYNSRRGTLVVEATSFLKAGAQLALTGYGPMKWIATRSVWSITVKIAGQFPATVKVSGPEGFETASVISQ